MSDNNAQQQPISGDTAIDMDKIGRPSTETSQPLPHMGMDPQRPHAASEEEPKLRGGGEMCPGRFCFIIPCPIPINCCVFPCPC